MKKADISIWKKNIYEAISSIANIQLQKMTWLGKHPTLISSFSEEINTLYADFSFEDFLNMGDKLLLHPVLQGELRLLKKLIDGYEEAGTDEAILEDPRWHEITNQAQKIISIWETESLS
jgi:hypothetical protein